MLSEPVRQSTKLNNTIEDDHFIVAIGASAGGLEAIHEFFDHMPETNNCSFVIIQHLSPDYKSLLVDLVSKHTHMKVFEAENDLTIHKNCIYVIPNNKLITIKSNKLRLEEKTQIKAPNTAIDIFLHSLAREKKNFAIALILSGTGTDGTKGIEAIKSCGGVVIVQDPATSKFDGMPNSAINSGNADYILSPAAMPQEIISYISEPLNYPAVSEKFEESLLEEIFQMIHQHMGHDFHYYKTPTIVRRIIRRMIRGNFKEVGEYIQFLSKNPSECKQLGKEFLIAVTKFFRDSGAFNVLREKVLPAIIDEKDDGGTIKVWVSACSTGEEAYSIAILIDELLDKIKKNLEVKIFATDIDESNIEIASKGVYPLSIANDISPEMLDRYFTKKEKYYVVIPRIRKQIVFARHNIIKDPPFIKNDLVSCRNMLIYVSPILQQRIFSILLFSVKKDGYLFFGSSENPSYIMDNVTEVHGKWKIYKKDTEARFNNHLSDVPDKRGAGQPRKLVHTALDGITRNQKLLWEEFRELATDEFSMAAFYIDKNFEIKEAIGNFEKILSLPKKYLSLNLLRMLPSDISPVISAEIKKAWKENQRVLLRNLQYHKNNKLISLQVVIKPSLQLHGTQQLTTIVFSENCEEDAPLDKARAANNGAPSNEYVQALEAELSETKNNLQLAIEDLETANEELQSSNEELLSANEELQSSNEELQSLNEELHTLNTEHQIKIKELIELNDDLNNYFRSTDIGQIFLDKNLNIRKFNPVSARMINFIESDIGRPITHISTNIKYENLVTDVKEVLNENKVIEKEVQLLNGKSLLMRILPYLTRDKEIGGVVISFIDITTIVDLNNIVRGVFNSSLSAIFAFKSVKDNYGYITDFAVLTANYAANVFLHKENENLAGKSLKKDLPLLDINSMFDQYVSVVTRDKSLHTGLYIENEDKWYEVTAVKMMDGFVATFTDVTEKKQAEQTLKKNYTELITVKENLKKLNADLENKVTERTKALSLSEERFRLVAQATNDALWDWDFANNKMWWGDSFFKLFGYAKSDQFDRNAWLRRIHPEDREGVQASIDLIINSHQNQWSKEYRFLKSDGKYANILDRGYVLHDEYGTPYRMLGSMLDLTELKKAEQEVASNVAQKKFIIEAMPLIVLMTDAAGNLNFTNKQFELYTGITEQEAQQSGWKKVIHEEDLDQLTETWKEAVEYKSDFQREVRIKVRNSTHNYHWNLLRARARKDENGSLFNWVVTIVDIHEQKVANEILEERVAQRTKELQDINIALERSNYDLQQFASVASHDLQEPLRKIHMFSKLIRDKHSTEMSEAGAFYLDKIMQASNRMKSMIRNILNLSKLSAEKSQFLPTDLKTILTELIDDFEITIREKQAEIDIGNFPVIEVIPEQIRQVLLNLLSNAFKFSKPDHKPVIRIRATRIEEKSFDSPARDDGPFCKISISDNGIGFDDQFKETIFILFHRLHSKDKYEGTGIGLAITKKIIEKHNGIITASGVEGEGATFEIILPVQQAGIYEH